MQFFYYFFVLHKNSIPLIVKILHTSDWHLGHMLYNYDRTEEQQEMLEQMASIVRERQPDVFLLCGDVYHTSQPSAAVQTMLTKSLVKIHEACPEMTIVMTAGNHDSGSKHEIFRIPWEALNVYAVGQLDKENPDSHIIEVPGKGWVIAVPYASERIIPDGFFQQLLDRVAERNAEGRPVVMCAHTTVKGCDFTGHEHASETTVGGIDSMMLEQLGEGYDYLALGHIHHEQFVHSGHHNVYYSGTPIAVSFDENYPHSVALVEIASHGDRPQVEKLEIENLHPLVTLPTEGTASWEDALELLKNYPDDIPAYIRFNVEIDDFLPPDAKEKAVALTEGKLCRFCHINVTRNIVPQSEARVMTVQEFQAEAPVDLMRRYSDDAGINFDNEMEAMFNEVVKLVEEEERNDA